MGHPLKQVHMHNVLYIISCLPKVIFIHLIYARENIDKKFLFPLLLLWRDKTQDFLTHNKSPNKETKIIIHAQKSV